MAATKFTPMTGLRRILETGLIMITIAALYMLLSLATYNPSDPGWSQTAWGGAVHNAAGNAGAWLADLSFFVFGAFSYLIPFLMVAVGYVILWRPYKLLEVDFLTVGLRLVGFVFLYLSSAAMASMNFTDIHNFSAGGVIGDVLYTFILPIFGQLGATLVLLCCIAGSITLLTGWSWLMLAEKIGEAITGSLGYVYHTPSRIAGWFAGKAGYQKVQPEGADLFDEDDEDDALPVIHSSSQDLPRSAPRFTFKKKQEAEPQTDIWSDDDDEDLPREKVDIIEPELQSGRKEPSIQFSSVSEKKTEPTFGAMSAVDDDDEDWFSMPWTPEEQPASAQTSSSAKAVTPMKSTAPLMHIEPSIIASVDAAPIVQPASTELTPLQKAEQALKEKALKKASIGDLPAFGLLDMPAAKIQSMSKEELDRIARLVETKLADYNVQARVVGVYPGPVITRFELDLAPGMKASKITGLSRDLARSLSAVSVRVVEVIPGKPYVGLELPNRYRQTVSLREVLDSESFNHAPSPMTLVLGQDIAGEPMVVDLAQMPHLLVAGTTGSGKSVGVNAMIISMLYKATPEEVRFIMIDPKMLELSVYEGIPHLLTEVVTDMKDASNALRWCVGEMERRYKLMSVMGVRNLKGYNAKIGAATDSGNPIKDPFWRPGDSFDEEAPDLERLPHIVVIVDEFADMMMMVGKKLKN